jgi:DNA-directed RNA polymerase subunit RPC12/RpoP
MKQIKNQNEKGKTMKTETAKFNWKCSSCSKTTEANSDHPAFKRFQITGMKMRCSNCGNTHHVIVTQG